MLKPNLNRRKTCNAFGDKPRCRCRGQWLLASGQGEQRCWPGQRWELWKRNLPIKMLSVPGAAAWCSQACSVVRILFNIRHFVWLLLLLALFLFIIFDFLLLPYQLRLLFSVKLGISFLKKKKKIKGELFSPLLTLKQCIWIRIFISFFYHIHLLDRTSLPAQFYFDKPNKEKALSTSILFYVLFVTSASFIQV